MKVSVKIKKLNPSVLTPEYGTPGAAGMDLRADLKGGTMTIRPGEKAIVATGISLQIPLGYEVQIRPRSGLAAKNGVTVLNTPGTIDSDYRGEVKVILVNLGQEPFTIFDQDRIAQMVLSEVPQMELLEVSSLSDTDRGEGGLGSTGVK